MFPTLCQTDLRITDHSGHKFSLSLTLLSVRNSIRIASKLTTIASFPNVFFQLLQYSRQHPSFSAHWAALMTKTDLKYPAFSLRFGRFRDLEKHKKKWLVSNRLTSVERYRHGIYVDRLQAKIKYSIWYTQTLQVPIEQVSSAKSLGAYVENLRWYSHLDKLCKKITSVIGATNWIKPLVPQSTLLCIYNSLVERGE